MKKSVKGALLSGIIFPGLGQLWQKHYLRGFALVVAVMASLAVIAMKAAQQAYVILEKAESEGGTADLVAILNMASRASATPDDLKTGAAFAVLLLCWGVGIVDAYLAGRKLDRQQPVHREADRQPPAHKGGISQ
ncbi:MAG TPA: hypothetical protein VJ550_16085 [Geomonas sp.]|nr:hypothetical protein [Geomonas sp.]